MKAAKNDPLLLEIQDEINRENMVRFINQYGKLLVVAGILVFLGIAGYQFWQQHRKAEASDTGTVVNSIMHNPNQQDEAALKKLDVASQTSGYFEIALLNKAKLQVKNNDVNGAVATYDEISKRGSEQGLEDLAALDAANLLLNTNPHAEGLEKRLTALTNSNFKYNARELLAAYYLQNNNKTKAQELLNALAKDPAVPVSISKRARDLASSISTDNTSAADNEED